MNNRHRCSKHMLEHLFETKKNKQIRILNINFAYFQSTTKELIASLYPTIHTTNKKYAENVWQTRYENAKTRKELISVKINEEITFPTRRALIKICQTSNPKTYVATEQVDILPIIKENVPDKNIGNISIWNVDVLPGISSWRTNQPITYATWLSALKNEYPKLRTHWISNDLSEQLINNYKQIPVDSIDNHISRLYHGTYDIIFICRNDLWTPPHLDKDFEKLLTLVKYNASAIEVSEDAKTKRLIF